MQIFQLIILLRPKFDSIKEIFGYLGTFSEQNVCLQLVLAGFEVQQVVFNPVADLRRHVINLNYMIKKFKNMINLSFC